MTMTATVPWHQYPLKLTPEEMLSISQDISLHFSPSPLNLTTGHWRDASSPYNFSPSVLAEISAAISRQYGPDLRETNNNLTLLAVDPHNAYVYWQNVNYQPDNSLVVRVFWRPNADPSLKTSAIWFDTPITRLPLRQQIPLPLDNAYYSACIGRIDENKNFIASAYSNIIHVPPADGGLKALLLLKNRAVLKKTSEKPAEQHITATTWNADDLGIIAVSTASRPLMLHFNDFNDWVDNMGLSPEALSFCLQKKKLHVELVQDFAIYHSPARFRKNPSGQL
jgi:hypothetical protein